MAFVQQPLCVFRDRDRSESGYRRTYFALLVRESHIGVPDLEAVVELGEMHFLDFHSKVFLQTLHHLENIT